MKQHKLYACIINFIDIFIFYLQNDISENHDQYAVGSFAERLLKFFV